MSKIKFIKKKFLIIKFFLIVRKKRKNDNLIEKKIVNKKLTKIVIYKTNKIRKINIFFNNILLI